MGEVRKNFSVKNSGGFGFIVFVNVAALVLIIIVIIVLKVVGCWCGLNAPCTLKAVLVLRGLAVIATIVAFVFVGTEQGNILEVIPTAKFGKNWQQILVLVSLFASILMSVIGGLLGVMQVTREPTVAINVVLLFGDTIVAIGLAAASIAAADVGGSRYFFLRQSIISLITLGLYALIMLVDAAHAFADSDGESKAQSTYKPSANQTSYKPSSQPTKTATATAGSRRQAPPAPREQTKERIKSYKGEVLVALYDYQGQESDELNFQEGDRIELTEDHADGWASGILLSTREEGLFPLNYTEKV